MDRSLLHKLYIEQELPASKIAQLTNTKEKTVRYWLEKYEIKRPARKKVVLTKELLIEHYIKQKKTIDDMINEFGVSKTTFCRNFKKYGILKIRSPRRGLAETLSKEQVQDWYNQGLNLKMMSEISGVHMLRLKRLLKELIGIEWNKDLRYGRVRKNYKKRSQKQNMKRFRRMIGKELGRQKVRKKGYVTPERQKIKSRVTMVKKTGHKISKAQKQCAEILKRANIEFEENKPILWKTQIQTGEIVEDGGNFDIVIEGKDFPIPIVIEVDGLYFHKRSESIKKDRARNLALKENYIVIRLWENEVNEHNVIKLLEAGKKAPQPIFIRLGGQSMYSIYSK